MRIYLKNYPAKFHRDLILNDGAWFFLKRSPQQEEEQQERENTLVLIQEIFSQVLPV